MLSKGYRFRLIFYACDRRQQPPGYTPLVSGTLTQPNDNLRRHTLDPVLYIIINI